MDVASTSAQAPGTRDRVAPILALTLIVSFHLGMYVLGDGPLAERAFRGPDSYTRLVQVSTLHQSGDWYQPLSPRSNTPFGEVRVWTRAFDLLLIGGAFVLQPLFGFHQALHHWAFVIAPLLHICAVLALMWAVGPLLTREARFYMAVLTPFQVSITAQFMAGRPDHHAAQAVLFILLLGFALRLATDGARRAPAVLAGLTAAAALWLSVEALVAIALLQLALGVRWLALGAGAAARPAFVLTATLFAALLVITPIERPPERWLVDEYDRLSIVHIWLFLLLTVLWFVLWRLSSDIQALKTAGSRVLAAFLGVATIALAVGLLFPLFYGGPMVEIPAAVLTLWQHNIAEFRPAVDWQSWRQSLYVILVFLGPAVPLLLYLPIVVVDAEGRGRARWLTLGAALLVYLPLSLFQLRWGIYTQLLALPLYADALQRFVALMARLGIATAVGVPVRAVFRTSALVLFIAAPVAIGWKIRPEPAQAKGPQLVQFCDIPGISSYLMRDDTFGDRPRRMMAYIFDGPEILYRTHHHIVATPDHRNVDGISDTIDFFRSTAPEAARRIVEARGIELVLICLRGREGRHYRLDGKAATLWSRLAQGTGPSWLRPLPLPPEVATDSDYRLFEVVR